LLLCRHFFCSTTAVMPSTAYLYDWNILPIGQ
jgi:hypothetical protein